MTGAALAPAAEQRVPQPAAAPRAVGRRWPWWLAVIAAWTLYSGIQVALRGLTEESGMIAARWNVPMMFAVGWFWAAITPLVFRLSRWAAPSRIGLARSVVVHSAAALGVALACTVVRRAVRFWVLQESASKVPPYAVMVALMLDYNVLTYLMLVVIGRALDGYRDYTARVRQTLALSTQLAQARLQFLQRQLQPHFLFNALNAIAELTRETPAAAGEMLRQLRRLLRSALDREADREETLRDELATLEPYIAIQRTRFSDALDITQRVDPAALDALVPTLVLQPLLENAIQHGIAGCPGRGRVEISAEVDGSVLRLRVIDNGSGPPAASAPRAPRQRAGIGLRNTRDRLTQLYGDAYRLQLVQEPGVGTVAQLDIPLHTASWARPSPEIGGERPAAPDAAGERRAGGALRRVIHWLGARWAGSRHAPGDAARGDEAASGAASRFTHLSAGAHGEPSEPPTPPLLLTPASAFAASDAGLREVSPRVSVRVYAALTALWLTLGVYWMAQACLIDFARDGRVMSWTAGFIDMVSAVIWAAITPLVLWLARTVRVTRSGLAPALALHAALAVAVAAAHLKILFSLGLFERALIDPYNVNQFTLNIFIYFAFVAWSHARDFRAWYAERGLAAAQIEAALTHAEWQALALDLRPQFVLEMLDRAAAVAGRDPRRAEQLVEQLAGLLRSLLDAASRAPRTVRAEFELLSSCLSVYSTATGRAVTLTCSVRESALDAPAPDGVFRALLDGLAAHTPADPAAPLRIVIETRARYGRTELRIHSSDPLFSAGPAAQRPEGPPVAAPAHAGVVGPTRSTSAMVVLGGWSRLGDAASALSTYATLAPPAAPEE